MKKSFLFIYLLLLGNSALAQLNSGKITYGLHIADEKTLSEGKYVGKGFIKAMENAKYLTFTLLFRDSISQFDVEKTIDNGDNGTTYARIFSMYAGRIFQKGKFSYTSVGSDLGNYVVKKPLSEDWKFENESKSIDNFVCYKATSTYKITNEKGSFTYPVTAWFCPTIPVPYGPLGYGGLPGLILELQVRNVTYGAKTLDLDPKNHVEIKPPSKNKVISETEFNEIIAKKMKKVADENKKRKRDREIEEMKNAKIR